jgi:hypothetical protein
MLAGWIGADGLGMKQLTLAIAVFEQQSTKLEVGEVGRYRVGSDARPAYCLYSMLDNFV